MDKYEVMMYPKAIQDIDDIYAYIALVKQAPKTAREQTDRIWNAIDKLEDCPQCKEGVTVFKLKKAFA